MNTFQHTIRAFRYPNYRLFFMGQGLSLIGTWMQQVAQGWLLYKLTDSPLMLGAAAFATQFMQFVIAPFAGVLSDRFDRRRIIIAANVLAMTQAFILAALFMSGMIRPWHILMMAALLGTANGFEMPTRHSFIPDIVEKQEDLVNAISLNSAMFNGARLIGPPIAGFVVAVAGEGVCFLSNAISYAAVIIALMMMKVRPKPPIRKPNRPLTELADGFDYVARHKPLRYLLLLMTATSLFGGSCLVFLPVFAKDILGGGPKTLGSLMAAMGAGALVGAVVLAGRRNVRGLGRLIVTALCFFGGSLVCVALSGILWLSVVLLACAGYGMMVYGASTNTLLQTITDDDKRGRVMSFYIMAFSGLGPIGSLLMGWAARFTGVRLVVIVGGLMTVISGMVFSMALPELRKLLRPVYVNKGIITEAQEMSLKEEETIR